MSFFKFLSKSFLVTLVGSACALCGNQESRLFDLDSIYNIFKNHYAPKEWKEKHLGWDLEKEYHIAKEKIKENPELTPSEFHDVIRNFVRTTQDYHVGCNFESTEGASLPFTVKSANGRYFVHAIDHKKLDSDTFPISLGDELLALDDQPIGEATAEIFSKIEKDSKEVDQSLAEFYLTHRHASSGITVPKGAVKAKFSDRKTGICKTYQMVWHYYPEYVTFHKKKHSKPKKQHNFNYKMIVSKELTKLKVAKNRHFLGDKHSDLPPLGKIIWENPSENIFEAYIFQTPEGEQVGFLRIPTYSILFDFEEHRDELVTIITRFEEDASKLVIDQRNNPGGYLHYLNQIASFFAVQPLATPKHRLMMSPIEIAYYSEQLTFLNNIHSNKEAKKYFGDEFDEVPVSLHLIDMLKLSYEFLISEWESGKNLSGPTFIQGIDRINPNPEVVFTKPILLLINELSMSCGDIFPAILQDNKRAVIMGSRSTGAGGAVVRHRLLNNDGISSISYTATILERDVTKMPIENLGVTPDILYKETVKDLQKGYKEYKAAILEALKSL